MIQINKSKGCKDKYYNNEDEASKILVSYRKLMQQLCNYECVKHSFWYMRNTHPVVSLDYITHHCICY